MLCVPPSSLYNGKMGDEKGKMNSDDPGEDQDESETNQVPVPTCLSHRDHLFIAHDPMDDSQPSRDHVSHPGDCPSRDEGVSSAKIPPTAPPSDPLQANNQSVTSFGSSFTSSACQDSSSRPLSQTATSSTSLLNLAPRIEDFEILKPISRGAFGKVFLCHRKDNPDRKLAVKVLKKHEVIEKNLVSQVIAERNALAITKSPFCVNLFYCLQTHNNVFLVMEYMIGGDLKSLLGMYGYFEESMAVFYIAEVILALQYLHAKGIIHRDVKPDNMLISQTGHVKLTDFGLSTVGLDRELQVADLIPKTPWNNPGSKAALSRLVRTPGQILSLTSHLSFSGAATSPGSSPQHGDSLGGSYTHIPHQPHPPRLNESERCEVNRSLSARPTLSTTPSAPPKSQSKDRASQATPATRGTRFVRKKSFCDVPEFLHATSRKRKTRTKSSTSSRRSGAMMADSFDNSSSLNKLSPLPSVQQLPVSSSSSSGEDKRSSVSSSIVDDVFSEDKENVVCGMGLVDCLASPDDNSRGSLSSSPKHLLSSTVMSPHPNISPVDKSCSGAEYHCKRGRSGWPTPRYPDPIELQEEINKVTPQLPLEEVNLFDSQAKANMRVIRTSVGSPEQERAGHSFDSDLHLECRLSFNLGSGESASESERDNSMSSGGRGELNSTAEHLEEDENCMDRSWSSAVRRFDSSDPGSPLKDEEIGRPSLHNSSLSASAGQSDITHHMASSSGLDCCTRPEEKHAESGPSACQSMSLGSAAEGFFVSAAVFNSSNLIIGGTSADFTPAVTTPHVGMQNSCGSSYVSYASALEQHQSVDTTPSSAQLDSCCSPAGNSNATVVGQLGSADSSPGSEAASVAQLDSCYSSEGPKSATMAQLDSCCTKAEGVGQLDSCGEEFKYPASTAILRKRRRSCEGSQTGLTQDISDLLRVRKRSCVSMNTEAGGGTELSMQPSSDPPHPPPRSSSSTSSSSSSSLHSDRLLSSDQEMEEADHQFSTPLSALPTHLKGLKAVKFLSPAGVTPVLGPPAAAATTGAGPPPVVASSATTSTPNCRHASVPTPAAAAKRSPPPHIHHHHSQCSPMQTSTPHTPFRTPKSVARKPKERQGAESRILGTPDYLAPELLLRQGHDAAVDWWSVGVCLYEFMTGIPPFNDATPELVFNNILSLNIEWPEGEEALTAEAVEAIMAFLTLDPTHRANATTIRSCALMRGLDWDNILDLPAPFVPRPDDASDTTYFATRNNLQGLTVSGVDL